MHFYKSPAKLKVLSHIVPLRVYSLIENLLLVRGELVVQVGVTFAWE